MDYNGFWPSVQLSSVLFSGEVFDTPLAAGARKRNARVKVLGHIDADLTASHVPQDEYTTRINTLWLVVGGLIVGEVIVGGVIVGGVLIEALLSTTAIRHPLCLPRPSKSHFRFGDRLCLRTPARSANERPVRCVGTGGRDGRTGAGGSAGVGGGAGAGCSGFGLKIIRGSRLRVPMLTNRLR
ncbi:hypothetical protein BDV95DRAFT_590378 [Massariosphaeria phaeospora]|uniref:Uncharacterized protein n=1 Tax=Massariosphaeria phaeospora TaxID=100035 RepID=A0A7C8IF26_9PLEO|nr:hypothetical protein BDV95DRAFT_590378 [Massariosphaeria phaeospora]